MKYEVGDRQSIQNRSCPSRGTWIEMTRPPSASRRPRSRAPRGARGLKWFFRLRALGFFGGSCPSRGTWIEIPLCWSWSQHLRGRAPRGARGLKFPGSPKGLPLEESCPSRGTWIEIGYPSWRALFGCSSCPSRGTWIEICRTGSRSRHPVVSCPSRGTWIEIDPAS